MAGAITHIVLADKIFDEYFSDKDKRLFFLGTVFPDIRYLVDVDREKTHFSGVTSREILESESFVAGMKLHAMVDLVREDYMEKNGLYTLFDDSELRSAAVKTYEDRLLYGKVSDWKLVDEMFTEVVEEEVATGIERGAVETYHNYMRVYFSKCPDAEVIYRVYTEVLGRPVEMAKELVRVMESVSDQEKAEEIITEFYEEFEEMVMVNDRGK